MNKVEVGKLLTIAAGFDNRKVDQITVESWAMIPGIQTASFEDARAAVVAHQTGPKRNDYLQVGHIVEALASTLRLTPQLIAEDVRSARARKMVSLDWEETEPLPIDVALRLADLRAANRKAFIAGEVEDGKPITVGNVGRSL